ncbi:hypothetical protein PILCRDRAFT_6152 [Piloderma croceum F 1598]|uniref:Uncharacterized protein n=1 Tax=Piloderma croceum (strain F 1598) TaxID=765440 RepID=A0A0C3C4C8_PILCF|nr:hypothetical protein PILCRDRAFT_6152 [Piloderma croceum F 1598]
MRLAFLRWHILNYANLDGDKWWLKVDDNLVTWRSQFKTEVALSAAFSSTYNEDKEKFGDPASSGIKVVEVQKLDGWQTTLNAHARNVVPAASNSTKRKRTDE